MILRPLFCFKDTKNTGLLIFNSLKQKKLIFNFVVNRNWKKLTDSRKRAKILTDNRKSYHPIRKVIRGGGGRGIFEPQEFFSFFRYQIPCMNFFCRSMNIFLGLIGVHDFFSFHFPLHEYFFFCSPISFLMVCA